MHGEAEASRGATPRDLLDHQGKANIGLSQAAQFPRDGEPKQPVPLQISEILGRKLAGTVVCQCPLSECCREGLTLLTEGFLLGGRGEVHHAHGHRLSFRAVVGQEIVGGLADCRDIV